MAAKRRDWQAEVEGLLTVEPKRRDLRNADVGDKLAVIGAKKNGRNISNKNKHGSFIVVFIQFRGGNRLPYHTS